MHDEKKKKKKLLALPFILCIVAGVCNLLVPESSTTDFALKGSVLRWHLIFDPISKQREELST